jgi:hypothetical protein
MRIATTLVCLSLFALLPLSSRAQSPASSRPVAASLPPFLLEGLHQLANQKPEEAEKAWARGTPAAEGQPDARKLHSLLADCGAYQNFDVISVQDLTPRLRVIYLALNFEREPDIARFLLYKTTDGWVLLGHKFDVDEASFESIAQPARP